MQKPREPRFWGREVKTGLSLTWWGRLPGSWMLILSLCPHRAQGTRELTTSQRLYLLTPSHGG